MATPPFGGWPTQPPGVTGWGNTAKGTAVAANIAVRAQQAADVAMRAQQSAARVTLLEHGEQALDRRLSQVSRYSLAPHEHVFGTNSTWTKGRRGRQLDMSSIHSGMTCTNVALGDTFRRSHSVPPYEGYTHVTLKHPY